MLPSGGTVTEGFWKQQCITPCNAHKHELIVFGSS
jgi:hypothetical protein